MYSKLTKKISNGVSVAEFYVEMKGIDRHKIVEAISHWIMRRPLISNNTRAETGTRTRDLLITNELLYQLSYFGLFSESDTKVIIFLNIGTLLLSFL